MTNMHTSCVILFSSPDDDDDDDDDFESDHDVRSVEISTEETIIDVIPVKTRGIG